MDIFNDYTISDLLLLAEYGENSKENSGSDIDNEPTFTRKLVYGKVLIDRWENITSDIFIHTSKADLLFKELSKNDYYVDKEDLLNKGIWGASIYAVDNIPEDKCLMAALDGEGNLLGDVPSRAVAVFTI